jgi:hypothetical protein
MKYVCSVAALLVLMAGAPTMAVPFADGLNTGSYSPADPDIEGEFNAHDDWFDGDFKVIDGAQSSVPAGWKFAQQDWNGEHGYHIEADTGLKSEGDASMKITHLNTLPYQDIFAGVMITGMTVGETYDVSFDFQADAGQSPIGVQTGDDVAFSASWQVANVVDSPQGWGSTEDYPGHETGSIWIQAADWDGAFHTQSGSFEATAESMAFVLKYRAMGADGQWSIRLDNLNVTPEPASLGFLALGGLALLRRRR